MVEALLTVILILTAMPAWASPGGYGDAVLYVLFIFIGVPTLFFGLIGFVTGTKSKDSDDRLDKLGTGKPSKDFGDRLGGFFITALIAFCSAGSAIYYLAHHPASKIIGFSIGILPPTAFLFWIKRR
jgi:hypothetical protein